jgi:hypothetical protein
MRLTDIAAGIGALIPPGQEKFDADIRRVIAGDRMSDLLSQADETTLIVTNLAGLQLMQLAEIMDVPGVCLLRANAPVPELARSPDWCSTLVMISPHGMYRTCGRLHSLLGDLDGM